MATERMIDRLADGLAPVRRASLTRDASLFGALVAAEFALLMWWVGMRADLVAATAAPNFWWKMGGCAALAVAAAATALTSFRPTARPRAGMIVTGLIAAGLLAAALVLDRMDPTPADLAARLDWREGLRCLRFVALLSAPLLTGLALMMRRAAPVEPKSTALAAGLAAAAWSGLVFAFSCPHEDPLYVAVWYGLAIALPAAVARIALPRLTRW